MGGMSTADARTAAHARRIEVFGIFIDNSSFMYAAADRVRGAAADDPMELI